MDGAIKGKKLPTIPESLPPERRELTVETRDGKVVVAFPRAVTELTLRPNLALELARVLRSEAKRLNRGG